MLPKITQVKTRRAAKKTKILSWRMLTKHDWLAYNREKKKAFCSTFTAHRETQKGAFNSKYGEGFDNWKNGAEKMKDHEESFVHRAACATMVRAKHTIAATFSSLQVQKLQLWKQSLISHFKSLKTLMR